MYNHTQLSRQQQQQLLQMQMNINNMNNNINNMNNNNMNNMNNGINGINGINGNNGDDGVSCYDLNKETGIKNRLPNLRYHVFISKETTKELSDYILPEPWGDENGLLYKYLDYVWRCQLFDREIKKFYCRNEGKLVFHSGLQRRSDGEFVYLLLIRNDADSNKKVDQKWRVALGIQNGLHSRNMSFVTKQELLKHYWRYDESLLPKRTLFYSSSSKDLIFNINYRFEIDWEERLRTCKNRIYKTLSNDGNRKGTQSSIDESVLPIKELQRRFESETRKSISLSRANPRIGVPQAFIESKNGGYRLELLIPLTLYFSNRVYYFALALRPHHDEKVYEGMSILTREMAYANARLVGSIDSSWLTTRFATDNVGAAQHCSCTCHNFCNTGINPDHIHNLADHKRKYNNDIPHDRTSNNNNNHTNKLKINTKSNGNNNNNNILSPSVTPRHSGHNTPNSHHNNYNSHHSHHTPKLNRTYSSDSNPYLNINNNNTQIRNRFNNQNNHTINNNNNAHHINAFNMRMNGNVPLNPMNTMNMYSTTPGTPAAATTNPYSTALSMNSPNNLTTNNPLKNGINTATTNPFSFVATTATGTTPNPYTVNSTTTNPYNTNTNNATNPYNPLSLLTSAANPVNPLNPLNPTFITSVPNVPNLPPGSGAPLQGSLFGKQNISNTNQSTNPSPNRVNNNRNQLSITTPKPTITTTTTTPLALFNPSGIPSVSNTSLAAYGIPTIGPPTIGSVVNMPIAQMSGPQSIGSSVPSSVPIINPSLPPKTQLQTALSNTINTMSANNNNNNMNNNSNGNNNNLKQNVNNNNMNGTNNNSNPSQTTDNNQANGKTENTESQSNGEGIKNTSKSKIVKTDKDGQDLTVYQPEPLNVGAIEQKHDGQTKQGFSEDMFADASPRTKEVFNGLTFDEEDEVYSLQPKSKKSASKTTTYKSSVKDRDNKNIPRAKSFHTNPHLPPLSYASHHNGSNNNNNNYRSSSNNNILSKTPTSHHPSGGSWKAANPSYNDHHSNTSSPSGTHSGHGGYNNQRDTSSLHLRQLHQTVRQHSHDGIHRTKSEHIIVNTNKTNPFSNNNYNTSSSSSSSQQPGSRSQRQRQQRPSRHDQYSGHSGYYAGDQGPTMNTSSYNNNESSIYAQDYPTERMMKSQSQPSLADMMQMQVGHDQFQQFQEMNQNITNENQQQSNNKQNTKHTQLNSPIQEDHPSGMINMYHD